MACHDKSPYGWRNASQYRDAGDLMPRANRRVLAYAADRNIPLTAEHLIWGADRAEIEALMVELGRDMPQHLRLAKRPVAQDMAAE